VAYVGKILPWQIFFAKVFGIAKYQNAIAKHNLPWQMQAIQTFSILLCWSFFRDSVFLYFIYAILQKKE
jgi:hypothetical protein